MRRQLKVKINFQFNLQWLLKIGLLINFLFNRDANAQNLHIYSEKRNDSTGDFILSILDDGDGMSPSNWV